MNKNIESSKAAEPVGKFPHAKRVGSLLFLSGIGPRVRGQKEIPGVTLNSNNEVINYDIKTQTHGVFENVKLVLEDAGLRLSDLVDVTVFLTNMKVDFKAFNSIWAEYFPNSGPCRTTVQVGALPTPIAIEFKCIAQIPNEEKR